MAQLNSPGVAVTVIDESFYTPAAPGTTPLIIVATEQDKANSAGTGTAPGTLKANAGKVYLMTSQMDLGTTFGTPMFETDASNNPVHAGERNEYGLQAAYSYLGVSSRAYVVRADIDLGALAPATTAPAGAPVNGAWWFDTADSVFGIFEWNSTPVTLGGSASAQTFTNKTPIIISSTTQQVGGTSSGDPLASIGSIGSYALVVTTTPYKLFYKNYLGTWVQVGSNNWTKSWPTLAGSAPTAFTAITSDYLLLKTSPTGTQAATVTATVANITNVTVISASGTVLTNSGTNGLAVGDIVQFSASTSGIQTAITTANSSKSYPYFYVVTGSLSTTTFQVSATKGGAAISFGTTGTATGQVTSTATNVLTSANASSLAPGDAITFPSTINGASQTAIGGITLGNTYYVVQVSGNNFSISATNAVDANGISWAQAPVQLTAGSGSMIGNETETQLSIDSSRLTNMTVLVNYINNSGGAINQGLTAAIGPSGELQLFTDGTVNKITVSGSTPVMTWLGLTASSYYAPALAISAHTSVPLFKTSDNGGRPTGSVWIKTTDANLGASYTVYNYSTTTNSFASVSASLYANNQTALYNLDAAGGGSNLPVGASYVKFNDAEQTFWEDTANIASGTGVQRASPALATFNLYTRANVGPTVITSKIVGTTSTTTTTTFTNSTAYTFSMVESLQGSASLSSAKTISFTGTGTAADAGTIAGLVNSAGFVNITASVNASNQIVINHKLGGDIRFANGTNTPLSNLFTAGTTTNLYAAPAGETTYTFGTASNWKAVSLLAAGLTTGATPPSTTTADGTIWYNASVSEVDILINTGTAWTGYKNVVSTCDANGPFVQATKPTVQTDGVTNLVTGDLWIDTSDLENYPTLWRYNATLKKWALVDTSDQTSENGIVFHDARAGTSGGTATVAPSGSIVDLLTSAYVDFDAPDPALYPKGMLLWNTRRSTFNVKQFKQNYIDITAKNYRQSAPAGVAQTTYYPHRWVSIAANQPNGAGTFGRKAQRAVVVQALQALINSNQAIRDEDSLLYNLLACPGYPEAVNELIALNYDRALASFIVADTPARLSSDATSISNWGNNSKGAVDNSDDGLVSTDPYVAFYYPWGYSSDNLGNNIVVPPSHMMLRTIALSDNVSYPWFAPAGTRRGGITNASAVGYVDARTGEFQSVALNSGQRDTLASIHVNPISFISGAGLVAYGQYTRQLAASSLDRINVARLVVYLRRQFSQLAKPYVFEPNDTITRNEIKQAAESLLLELVGQRAIYDYLVVCDGTNNTPARIDRSELYLDVAIEPVKAAEFIYIPLRLENTGAIKGLGQ
jgi:hypothetical protein